MAAPGVDGAEPGDAGAGVGGLKHLGAASAKDLAALCPAHHHVYIATAAPRAHQPIVPGENWRVRAVSGNHLGGVRLNLVAPRFATSVRGGTADPRTWASPVIGLAL